MNYIQILYLCILKQPDIDFGLFPSCCELHSNLVSLHSETTHWISHQDKDRCELHSNLVSLHSETTRHWQGIASLQLWITFKSCIFAFWNNVDKQIVSAYPVVNYIQILYLCILKQHKSRNWWCTIVVNYIQILYLCILKQHTASGNIYYACCELHSNLVSLHSETTPETPWRNQPPLWITFKSCIFAFWNNLT